MGSIDTIMKTGNNSIIFTTSGLVLSYGPDYPAGATTIIIAGAVYLAATTLRWVLSRGRS
jgi:zinc transport system permease protein